MGHKDLNTIKMHDFNSPASQRVIQTKKNIQRNFTATLPH